MINRNNAIVVVAVLLLFIQAGVIDLSEFAVGSWLSKTATVTKAVVVYESSLQPILPHTMAARAKVELLDVEYRIVDQHVETGDGYTPKDFAPAIEAAQTSDVPFPVLVLLDGETALSVVPLPPTASDIAKEVADAR